MKNLFRSLFVMLSLISSLVVSSQVPKLNSYTSASTVIFLDFDGHTVANTSWNVSGTIYAAGSGLNSTQITEIFNRVAEDYRPFNLNVTTDSTKYLAAPVTKRMRVIITTSNAWYGSGAGGVSFVGSFTWGDNTPAFVFSNLLGYNVKYTSEAASHEAGHTLGLYHQASYNTSCQLSSEYNYGTGSGETSWAPIMGVGYYKNSTTWYDGPNPYYGCNSSQKDLDIITGTNGFGYRTDDFGETTATATNENFTNNQFSVNGMITTPTDKDMLKFTLSSTKRFVLNATPTNVGSGDAGSNLDMSIQLYNGTTPIGTYNPLSTLSASIDTTLNPGTYYVSIDGVGNDYTNEYGSLGSYSILAQQAPAIVLPLRRLELQGEANGDKHQFSWIIDADEQVVEQILEISTDGRNFIPVTQPSNNDRAFVYRPNVTSTVQYRLNVTFDNSKQYYSNVITIHSTGSIQRPVLVSNLIYNVMKVNSPGNYSYTIYDLSGKSIGKGQLTNGLNTISAGNITAGMYLIRFANDNDQWTDKFIKQ